jgi:diacylglycerol kinase family enzyme
MTRSLPTPTVGSDRILVVHNRDAGTDGTSEQTIHELLRRHGLRARYCDHQDRDWWHLLDDRFDLVIAAGGDGTVADVATRVQPLGVPMAILPLGGSNNIARSLGLSLGLDDLIDEWSLDRTGGLDIGEARFHSTVHPFVEAVGAGVFNHSVQRVDKAPSSPPVKRRNGRWAFRDVLTEMPAFTCRVEADRWSWEGQALLIEAMNLPAFGPWLGLAPAARIDDGKLDIVIAEPSDREPLLDWCRAFEGAPPLEVRTAEHASITVGEQSFRIDDDALDCSSERETLTLDMRRGAVRVLVPSRQEQSR